MRSRTLRRKEERRVIKSNRKSLFKSVNAGEKCPTEDNGNFDYSMY